MLIRHAQKQDAGALAELASRTFHDTFSMYNNAEDMAAHSTVTYGESIQESEILDDQIRTLVVEHESRLIAFAQLRMGPAPEFVPGRTSTEIWRFYVDNPYIGKGVAGSLMKKVAEELRSLESEVAWLGVWEHNLRARAFYRKIGFRDVGSQIYQVGRDPQTDIVMACTVSDISVP